MLTQSIPYKTTYKQQEFHHKQSWWQIMRPLTLTGTISPIIAGTIVASKFGSIHFDKFFILIITAVLIQASVNILNDYFDFANGQDKEKWQLSTEKERMLDNPQHKYLPFVAVGMFIIAAVFGIWLAINSRPIIILIGIIGIYAGYKYSAGGKKSFSALGLGEVTAAIFLGIVPTMLAFIIQDISLNWTAFAIGFLFALLISMMILTNNIRDIQKDKGFRQTIAMRMGKKRALKLLNILIISVYVTATLLMIKQVFPWSALIIYLALPITYQLIKAFNNTRESKQKENVMKIVAKHHWIFSILLIIGMLINLLFIS